MKDYWKTNLCRWSAAILLFSLVPAKAQVSEPEDRENDLQLMEEILVFPGERDNYLAESLADFFHPTLAEEIGPSATEILNAVAGRLEFRGLITRQGQDPMMRFETHGIIRTGQEITFTYQEEQYTVTFISISPNSYTLSLDEETLTVDL